MAYVDLTPILKDDTAWHFWQADDGCEVAPECTKCPLPKCRFDETLVKQTSKTKVAIIRYLERDYHLTRKSINKILRLASNTSTNLMFRYKKFTNEELQEYFNCEYLVDLVLDKKVNSNLGKSNNGS